MWALLFLIGKGGDRGRARRDEPTTKRRNEKRGIIAANSRYNNSYHLVREELSYAILCQT
jgi:hypothetical protein